LAPEIEDI